MNASSLLLMTLGCFVLPAPIMAQESSTNLNGMLGLNTIPSARMDKVGTIRIGAGTVDPYVNSFIGFQVAEPLYINLRQTGEVSSITSAPKRLYPGLDFKLRLRREDARYPEVVIGANSAFGHKRTASEYISTSKRINNFDISAGIGWDD